MPLDVDRSLALPPDAFFPRREPKSGICLHHTVGGTASSSVNHWRTDEVHVGTAYMIGRDGTIFEIFDPEAWAWQFGLRGWGNDRVAFEKRFIGIEIASEGGLTEHEGTFYCFDRVHSRTRFSQDNVFDCGQDFRGYRYFARYKTAQIDAAIALVNHLCDTFDIPRRVPDDYLAYYGTQLRDFEGIIGHIHVRDDKSDPLPDRRFWERITAACALDRMRIGEDAPPARESTNAPSVDLDALWEENMQQIQNMQRGEGSMVKQVLLELKRPERDTHIRLRDAAGHTVFYEVVQGNADRVTELARALGAFEEVTASKLVVHS
jgi:hypothetical protein